MPSLVARVTAEHPELDCLINNAGVQRPLELSKDPPADMLARADGEIDINIRGPLLLSPLLLPHLETRPRGSIVNVSSVLGFVPLFITNPVYDGTKAWLHSWSMNLRTQLARAEHQKHINVVEIAPPMVATDLHRERADPDDDNKDKNPDSMTVDEFLDEVTRKRERGDDIITAGAGNALVDRWYGAFAEKYPG